MSAACKEIIELVLEGNNQWHQLKIAQLLENDIRVMKHLQQRNECLYGAAKNLINSIMAKNS